MLYLIPNIIQVSHLHQLIEQWLLILVRPVYSLSIVVLPVKVLGPVPNPVVPGVLYMTWENITVIKSHHSFNYHYLQTIGFLTLLQR